jgi:multidrug efflux pump subunit AcrB
LFRFTFRRDPDQKKRKNFFPIAFVNKKINIASLINKLSIEKMYRTGLASVLRHPKKWFAIAGAASIVGALLLLIRPAVFVSPDAAEEILVSVEFPPGTIPESIGVYGAALSGFINELPCVSTAYGRAGAEEEDVGRRADTDYRKETLVIRCAVEKGVQPEKALAIIRSALEKREAGTEHFTASLQTISSLADISVSLPKDKTESLFGLSSMSSYAVTGKDRAEWQERAGIIEKKLNEKNTAGVIRRRPAGVRPELRLYPNRETAAYFGISAADIAESLHVMNEGYVAASLEIEGRPLDIRVSGNPDFWNKTDMNTATRQTLEDIPVKTPQGKTLFLGSLARIERREADAVLARLDRADVVYIDIPQDKPLLKAAEIIDNSLSWFFKAGESVFSRYRNALLLTIVLAALLIYMTMGAQFESFLLPLALMLTIPLSLAGAGPALLLFNSRLDSGAVMGICALFGLVVNNGLILFEISEERLRSGYPPAQAVYGGASLRLRPILITTLTTIVALLPVVLNPLGSAQKSMAASMFGGLVASSLLSLFILPPVFIRFFSWRESR